MVFILRQLFNKGHFTKRISFILYLDSLFQHRLFLKLNINASTKNWNKSNPTSTDRHFLIKIPPHFSKSLLTIHLLQWKSKNQQDCFQKTNSFKNKFSITYVKRLLFLSLHSCCITNLIKFWIIIILLLWVLITSKKAYWISYRLETMTLVDFGPCSQFVLNCSSV